jgi:hypothetical protein
MYKLRDFTLRDICFICDLDEKEFAKYNGPCAMTALRAMAEPDVTTIVCTLDDYDEARLGFAIVRWEPDRSYIAELAVVPEVRRKIQIADLATSGGGLN